MNHTITTERSVPQQEAPRVVLESDVVLIERLPVADPPVVELVVEADDPEEAVLDALGVGSRAIRAAGTTQETQLVERAFAELCERFDREVEVAVDRITGTARGLLDEDEGDLRVTLDGWADELEHKLGDAFDA